MTIRKTRDPLLKGFDENRRWIKDLLQSTKGDAAATREKLVKEDLGHVRVVQAMLQAVKDDGDADMTRAGEEASKVLDLHLNDAEDDSKFFELYIDDDEGDPD